MLNFAGSAAATASARVEPATRPASAGRHSHRQFVLRGAASARYLLARGIEVGERVGFLLFAVPSAAGEGGLDHAVHPGDEIRGVFRRGRRRRVEVDRARRRVGIQVEHPGIRLVVEGAQHDPAAASRSRSPFQSKRVRSPVELERLDHATVLHELEMVHRDRRAHRDAHRELARRAAARRPAACRRP